MRAGSSRLYAGTQSRNSNPSYSLPARHARRRETTFRLWFNHYRTSIAFRTYFRAAKLKRLHHCAARRMADGVRTGVSAHWPWCRCESVGSMRVRLRIGTPRASLLSLTI